MISLLLKIAIAGSIGLYLLFRKYPWLKHDLKFVQVMFKLLRIYKAGERSSSLIVDKFEAHVKDHPKKTFLIFQDNYYSYEFVEEQANKVANVALGLGLKRGDVVAMIINNEPAFIWTTLGLQKIGVEPAYLNFNLRSKSLLHCFKVSDANILIVGQDDDLIKAVEEIRDDLKSLDTKILVQGSGCEKLPEGMESWDSLSENASSSSISRRYRQGIKYLDTALYIYTSGTTGLPKAAIVTHAKCIKAASLMQSCGANENDIFYTPLPLYHSAASLIALGCVIDTGATLVLSKKFSVTHFFEDCKKHRCTVIQYIGELCRYLLTKPKAAVDKEHNVRIAFGNGLRTDIWKEFQERFNIAQIGEFYSATEANAGFINFFNKFGAIGRCSPLLSKVFPLYFIKYDFETALPVRDAQGRCIRVKPGEPGLMVSQIKRDMEYEGYRGNRELSEKKIIRDVLKTGDVFYNSGDLMVLDEEYFLYFNDRIGDTFRWKGENVSTVEVSNVVSDLSWIEDANVYGVDVQGHEGRAGMVAVTLASGHSLTPDNVNELYKHCSELLPLYAIPRFIRFQKQLQVTTTFKQQKFDLVKQGFDPEQMSDDQLYVADTKNRTFNVLDKEGYQQVLDGTIRV